MKNVVQDEYQTRLLEESKNYVKDGIQTALEDIETHHPDQKGFAWKVYYPMEGKAKSFVEDLKNIGYFPKLDDRIENHDDTGKRACGLLKEGLSDFEEDEAKTYLSHLPSKELKSLLDGVSEKDVSGVDQWIRDVAQERKESLTTEITEALEDLKENPSDPNTDPSGFTSQMTRLRDSVEAFTKLSDAFGYDDTDVTQMVKEIGVQAGENLKNGAKLSELDNQALFKLQQSLEFFGDKSISDAIEKEISDRKETAFQVFKEGISKACKGIQEGDYSSFLNALKQISKKGDDVLSVYNAFGAKIDDTDKLTVFKDRIIQDAVKDLDVKDLKALNNAFHTEEAEAFHSVLTEVGYGISDRDPDLFKLLLTSQMDMSMLDMAISDRLKENDVEVKVFGNVENSWAKISDSGRDAIRTEFGLTISNEGKVDFDQ